MPVQEALAILRLTAGPRPHVVVGYSGGLDSTVLAHLLAAEKRQLGGLRLVHVDHGLHPESADWARHCVTQAKALKVPLVVLSAKVKVPRGESLEAVARQARYDLLAKALKSEEVLVTAQHLNDQAETLLLQLLRGAGLAGLSAMPLSDTMGRNLIVRPFLHFPRSELERYAESKKLRWIEDPSNSDERFARNFLRRRVMPLIREHWPAADVVVARAAGHLAKANELVEQVARKDLLAAADGSALNVAVLKRMTTRRRENAIRLFIADAGCELPSSSKLREMAGPLVHARSDAQPVVPWGRGMMRRRAGRLELEVNPPLQRLLELERPTNSWHWKKDREFIVNAVGDTLKLVADPAGILDLDKLPTVLTIGMREGGEKLRPAPGARTQALKKLLQAAKLTVEERARLPLLFAGEGLRGRLIAAGDRWLDVSVHANVKSRRRARLVWTRANRN